MKEVVLKGLKEIGSFERGFKGNQGILKGFLKGVSIWCGVTSTLNLFATIVDTQHFSFLQISQITRK